MLIASLLALLLLAMPYGALAQKPVPDTPRLAASFKHFAYSSDNGSPPDVGTIAQGPNGDLWLASTNGLFLFDGLQFQRFQPAGSDRLRSDLTYSMFIDSRGRVFFGYYSGGASMVVDGRVRSFEEGLPTGPIKGFAEDHQGRIWAISVKGLSWFDGTRWHALQGGLKAQDGPLYVMLVARDGTLWIATQSALLFIRPGKLTVERTTVPVREAWTLAQGPDGRLWLSDEAHGTRPIAPQPGTLPVALPPPSAFHGLVARRLLFDRSGGLWMALQRQPGLMRLAHPETVRTGSPVTERDITTRYREKGGLTSDLVGALFEDRHGVVWAGSRLGIDRFSPVSYGRRDEISGVPRTGFRAAQSASGTLAIADDDTIGLYTRDERLQKTLKAPGTVRGICTGGAEQMYAGGDFGLSQIVNGRLKQIAIPAGLKGPMLMDCQIDRAGRIWILTRQDGIFRLQAGRWTQVIAQEAIGAASPRVMVLDRQDRLWLGLDHHGLALFTNGTLRRFGAESGLDIGFVQSAQVLDDGMLLGGELGIAVFDGQRFHALTARDYPQFSLVSGIARDRIGGVWISGSRGITHLSGPAWSQLFSQPRGHSVARSLDAVTEMPFYSQLNCCANTILPAASGRLWFFTAQGVAQRDVTQHGPPPVAPRPIIRLITSNGQALPASRMLTLAKGHPDINIEYTSDSIAEAPQIRFRYRLTGGSEQGWTDAGSGRQAAYTALDNGSYRFELQARDASGRWNPETVAINFTVPPTFLQTLWPKVIGAIAAMALMALIYRVRLGYAVETLRKRLEERTRERERIARDLHDTLLQSVQALIFRVERARKKMEPGSPAFTELDASLEQAEDVLEETRRTVQGLRLWDDDPDLDHLLARMVTRFAQAPDIKTRLQVTGPMVPLNAEVGEEVERIIGEALTNVLRHSDATEVMIAAHVGRRGLRISVSDNGGGIPEDVLAAGQRAGHFGLLGMSERAKRLSAKLEIASSGERGTEITFVIPAIVAFKPRHVLPRWLGR
ncbi:ATP-binding protein [Novosphingobium sp.]|uniref:sensor histidine kinase n=1 Tax=Novosphingobium sp. TaxID=1874826 RepID=UPI0031E1ACEA